jgi:tetratricopeptide (TPR) repeat protein
VLAGIAWLHDHELAESLRLNVKMTWLNPGYPFQAFANGMNSFQLGEKERAIDWFNYALSISPDFVGAILAQGYIYELGGEYNKAFDYFLKTKHEPSPGDWVLQKVMLRILELGLETNRIPEVIEHYQNVMPDLFQSDVIIDKNNFISAYALGSLLKANGELEQAERLLKGSLEISQLVQGGSPHNNWECRIYLAMGNHKAAIASFVKLVTEGIHAYEIVSNPVYEPLYDDPDFKRSMGIMKELLKQERAKVKEMEANGELDIPPVPDN